MATKSITSSTPGPSDSHRFPKGSMYPYSIYLGLKGFPNRYFTTLGSKCILYGYTEPLRLDFWKQPGLKHTMPVSSQDFLCSSSFFLHNKLTPPRLLCKAFASICFVVSLMIPSAALLAKQGSSQHCCNATKPAKTAHPNPAHLLQTR